MKKLVALLSTACIASPTLAHDGHDHGHWTSDLIHISSIIAGITIVAIIAYSLKSKLKSQNKQEK